MKFLQIFIDDDQEDVTKQFLKRRRVTPQEHSFISTIMLVISTLNNEQEEKVVQRSRTLILETIIRCESSMRKTFRRLIIQKFKKTVIFKVTVIDTIKPIDLSIHPRRFQGINNLLPGGKGH